jgi:hypothetical protein
VSSFLAASALVRSNQKMELRRADHVNEAQGCLFSEPLDAEALQAQVLGPMRSTDTSVNPMGKIKESASRVGMRFGDE